MTNWSRRAIFLFLLLVGVLTSIVQARYHSNGRLFSQRYHDDTELPFQVGKARSNRQETCGRSQPMNPEDLDNPKIEQYPFIAQVISGESHCLGVIVGDSFTEVIVTENCLDCRGVRVILGSMNKYNGSKNDGGRTFSGIPLRGGPSRPGYPLVLVSPWLNTFGYDEKIQPACWNPSGENIGANFGECFTFGCRPSNLESIISIKPAPSKLIPCPDVSGWGSPPNATHCFQARHMVCDNGQPTLCRHKHSQRWTIVGFSLGRILSKSSDSFYSFFPDGDLIEKAKGTVVPY